MTQKLDASSSNTRLFDGPRGTKMLLSDLKKIRIDIQRQIGVTEKTNTMQRNIIDPDEVVLKRREETGEGSKPIFEREELTKLRQTSIHEEIPERRAVVTINSATSSRKRIVSMSPERRRCNENQRHCSRYEKSPRSHHGSDSRGGSGQDGNRYSTRNNFSPGKSSRDRRREHTQRHILLNRHDDHYKCRRNSSTYNYGRYYTWNRRYEDDSLRNVRMEIPPYYYLKPLPVAFYYENYARSVIVDPMMALTNPITGGRERMPIMASVHHDLLLQSYLDDKVDTRGYV